jgi:hypothetical protein
LVYCIKKNLATLLVTANSAAKKGSKLGWLARRTDWADFQQKIAE